MEDYVENSLQVKVSIYESCSNEIFRRMKINVKCKFPQIDFHFCKQRRRREKSDKI